MPEREWLISDYYADLGLPRDATNDEIADRYRSRAFALHPDRNPEDGAAEQAFKRLARAYAVLGNPMRRAAYDRARDQVFDRGFAPAPGTTRPPTAAGSARRLFRFNPRFGYVGACLMVVLGIATSVWIVLLTERDASVRNGGVRVEATVTRVGAEPEVTFTTATGERVTARAPLVRDRRNGGYRMNEVVMIRYQPDDPAQIVIDESQIARQVTMWIIAIKLLASGVILAGLSLRQHRRNREALEALPSIEEARRSAQPAVLA